MISGLTLLTSLRGLRGNIFAFRLFISPIPTFRGIMMRNECTEDFSGLPYLYALLHCLICAWIWSMLAVYITSNLPRSHHLLWRQPQNGCSCTCTQK
nr:PREDICTED: bidirectional sugar transporter SWEET2-like isoform X2 [Daucus carota subsp. sativus]